MDWIEYIDIPYDKVVEIGGTPILVSPRVILTRSPTTAMANYPPLFDPYPGYPISTVRVLVRPDEGIGNLRLERVHVRIKGSHQIIAVTGRVPRAGGNFEVARNLAHREMKRMDSFFELLYYALVAGSGPIVYMLKFSFGASNCGWALPWNGRFLEAINRVMFINRIPFKVLLVQISTDLIVSDNSLDRRLAVFKELKEGFNLVLYYSYPKYFDGGEVRHGDIEEAKRRVNQVIAFLEYLASQENSDVARQMTDLGTLWREEFAGGGYILSPVFSIAEFGKYLESPDKIPLLSPIPIKVSRDDRIVLLALTPSRGHAESYVNAFQARFRESAVVATYPSFHSNEEPRFLIAYPINRETVDQCLNEVSRNHTKSR